MEQNVWEQLAHVFDLSNGALSSDGMFAACVSHHADEQNNQFRTRVHLLRVHRDARLQLERNHG